MLRDLRRLDELVLGFRLSGEGSDDRIAEEMSAGLDAAVADGDTDGEGVLIAGLDQALTDGFLGALASYLLALERGERGLLDEALGRLRTGLDICGDLNLVPQWWTHRLALHLLSDLWDATFHERLPMAPVREEVPLWRELRDLFIASLHRRDRAEVDLWPSQVEAAARAVDEQDDLVASLPTSAGKTRVAELCILRCLAGGRRVVFVTPLRALSAQTEGSLRRTFAPLGKTVSALYGSAGVTGTDEDLLRERDIVVATPEKLDFALRNDPTLLDDVGLVVFDEGHMIGPGEREVRYEVQIQRLLRRADAATRRVVCLSAVLPDGDQLEDFAAWLRRDRPGGLIRTNWRPTRLRFGEVVWDGAAARLNLRVGDERPFVPRFITGAIPPIGQRRRIFPDSQQELTLAVAWRLVEDGQTALIFCPQRSSVEPFAGVILDLHARGSLRSVLEADPAKLDHALALGAEWLGAAHPVLGCLKLGVALHHGALPKPYRQEVERLLREGVLKVTISSPTLAQGLNLSATAVIMHSLWRNREMITAAEFRNVVGRAGRAYVDVEGLVLHPMFDDVRKRRQHWEALTSDATGRDMESGLVTLVWTLLSRLQRRVGRSVQDLIDYVANNAVAWTAPDVPDESSVERARDDWDRDVATLDTAILSLLGDEEVPDDRVAEALDEVLRSSLWHRRLQRQPRDVQEALTAALFSRARTIWRSSSSLQRRGYFLAGVGLATGQALDAIAPQANNLLIDANSALQVGATEQAVTAIITLAELIFPIRPFVPQEFPVAWRDILRAWLAGAPMEGQAWSGTEALRFVEDGLVYRLPWAVEALRVRALANDDRVGDWEIPVNDYELGLAVPALETGTMSVSAAILIQTGFGSRLAAIKAVQDTAATFASAAELRDWLASEEVVERSKASDWPTPSTHKMWHAFLEEVVPGRSVTWTSRSLRALVAWDAASPAPAHPVRLRDVNGETLVFAADGSKLGRLGRPLNAGRRGLLRATTSVAANYLNLDYLGPADLLEP
jgi:superfamily II DNA/RNA helicase